MTKPCGKQVSTYWPQLLYGYAVPLLVTSALLHWLISNGLYVFVKEGGYYLPNVIIESNSRIGEDSAGDSAASVGTGYSARAIMVLLIMLLIVLVFRP